VAAPSLGVACGTERLVVWPISRTDWDAKAPRWTTRQKRPVDHVFIHHGATLLEDHSQEGEARIVRAYQRYHFGKGWADLAYSFLVGVESGRVYEGRGWFNRPGATKHWNHRSYAICVIGDTTRQEISAAAVKAIKDLIEHGVEQGFIVSDFKLRGHRDVANKDCPGQSAYAKLDEMHPLVEAGKIPKLIPPAFTRTLRLRWPRSKAPLVKWVQAAVGVPLTGSYDWLTRHHVCRWQGENGLKPDGVVGPVTYNKMFRG